MQPVAQTITQFLFQIPLYPVWVVGAVSALVRWRRHPTVSLLALTAIVLFFLQSFGSDLVNLALPLAFRNQPLSVIETILAVRGIVQVFLGLIAWILVLAALFGWRNERARNNPD